MSFEDFCNNAYEVDKQIVSTTDSFVINFRKETGSAFSIDPSIIISFMEFLVENHSKCVSVIENDEKYSKASYLNYDEKPYRALYRLTADIPELKTISSLGGSQTKELTKVISKLICYLAGIPYDRIEDNTHFDLQSLTKALANKPYDIKEITGSTKEQLKSLRQKFFNWLIKKGKSERTAKSYSGTCINIANNTLRSIGIESSLEFIANPEELVRLHTTLKGVDSWNELNSNGGGMYDAGINSYYDFLIEFHANGNLRITSVNLISLSKPLILLAGISGTGKSRFVRQQAAAQGSEKEFLQMVPVRLDWHEPSDLLGYVSRIGGADRFIVTDALRFMVKAWRAAGAEVITLPDGKTGWTGKPLDSINTYWLCLDEMNLAPVEQYFADYLSVIESRSWLHNDAAEGHDYIYCCDPILPASHLKVVSENKSLAEELGLDIVNSSADKQLWDSFLQHGIPVPFNLVVAGTVNMDETTHGFSRKVIDRALTFDFGRFFPNDFANLWAGQPEPKVLGFARYSHARAELLAGCNADSNGQKTIMFLQAVNNVLRDTPFELAYRALNELLLAVICHNPADDNTLQAVWDDFMMCKVLPRIEGDDEKLAVSSDSDKNGNLLNKLEQVLETQLATIWQTGRPELLLETANVVPCRSKAKLAWMNAMLTRNSFTSFWP